MPFNPVLGDLTDITYSGSGTDDWSIEVSGDEGPSVLMGTYPNDDVYVDADDSNYSVISLKFIKNVDNSFDWVEYTDTITLVGATASIVIKMPPNTIADEQIYFVDNDGNLYTSSSLATSAIDWNDIIPEDTVTPSDVETPVVEGISDTVTPSDSYAEMPNGASDEIDVSDVLNLNIVERMDDSISVSDAVRYSIWSEGGSCTGDWEEKQGDIT